MVDSRPVLANATMTNGERKDDALLHEIVHEND